MRLSYSKPAGAKGGVDSASEPASQVTDDKKEKKRKVKTEDGSKSKKSKKE